MTKREIAAVLEEIAFLLELKGENPFKVKAYSTGARVIVDSSKVPTGGAALFQMAGITPAVVHLVRDPRAVAYSWRRPKRGFDRRGAAVSTWDWVRLNLAAEIRQSILEGRFSQARESFLAAYRPPDEEVREEQRARWLAARDKR